MSLKINEIFYSIQGEGILSGAPTIFIRTTGCNLRCHWCDTGYAFENGSEMELHEILDRVDDISKKRNCRRICLTGGEPLMHKGAIELIEKLLLRNHLTLETNGSLTIEPLVEKIREKFGFCKKLLISLDIKCPSSGEEKKYFPGNLEYLEEHHQLKFAVKDKIDVDFAFEILSEYPVPCPVIFQPVSGTDLEKKEIEEILNYIIKRKLPKNDIRFMLQLHKEIFGDRKGV